jgi:hypothetical protein
MRLLSRLARSIFILGPTHVVKAPRMNFHTAHFAPDACELTHASVAVAHALLRDRRPDLPAIMATVGASFLKHFGTDYAPLLSKTQDALGLSFVRMAARHGSWGADLHHYHSEAHALELLNGRLARTRLQLGWKGLDAQEWLLLALFSTCHDLRQREAHEFENGVGANERASIAEAQRILRAAGFDPTGSTDPRDAEFFETLAWMIAGSTFDARPESPEHGRTYQAAPDTGAAQVNSADIANSGGSLSSKLYREFVCLHPHYQADPVLRRRARLILLCADLDTANVGEPFLALVDSAVRLVREREMRCARSLDTIATSEAVFEFLTDGQERYFFRLHRFVSDIGRDVFGLGKTMNSPKLKRLTDQLRIRFPAETLKVSTGEQVIQEFIRTAAEIGG